MSLNRIYNLLTNVRLSPLIEFSRWKAKSSCLGRYPVRTQNQQFGNDAHSDAIVRFGPYEVDRRDGKLSKHGLRIKLYGQPLEVLLLLLDRPGELVTREELRQRLWPGNVFVDFERSLNSAVKKLRRALNDDAQEARYIETELRKGYRFIATVQRVSQVSNTMHPSPETGRSEAGISPDCPTRVRQLPTNEEDPVFQAAGVERHSHRRLAAVAAGIAVLLAVSTFVFYAANRKASLWPIAAGSKNANFRSSIAVLGLKNLSSGRDDDWLSTAITQMLSTELAMRYKVRIIPQERVSRAKLELGVADKDGYPSETLRALRTDLGADYAIAGSYMALGDRNSGQVRMDLRLQETISGETLASIAVSGKQSEIFDLVTSAGDQIRLKLGATVPPEGDADWRTVLPANPEAARLYSEGLRHLRVFESVAASELLQKSVILEPDFALGHAALAEVLSALGYEARAISSAQKALSLSNSLPEDERLEIEGCHYDLNHDWAGAIGVYRHLWQDFPDDIESGLKLAAAQTSAGDLNQALATLSSLRSLLSSQRDDPRIDLAEALVAAHNADYKRQQALAESAEIKAQSSGTRLLLARAQLVKGRALERQSQFQSAAEAYSIARQIFEQAADREGTARALNEIGVVLQKQGNLVEAREKFEQARDYFRAIGDENGLATVSTNLGELYRRTGRTLARKSSAVK
jgi:DNA-binding winged helix-turn-helix (wHTH) protein/tetratricopeptide (TPR) repeat protein